METDDVLDLYAVGVLDVEVLIYLMPMLRDFFSLLAV